MAPKIIEGTIQKGKIVPKENIPKNISGLEVRIIVLGKKNTELAKEREKYRGAVPSGWGDPLKYQRKLREEWKR